MNTLNHSATGAIIAIAAANPVIALPLAFVSHFVLDALPHNGYPGGGGYGEALEHRRRTFLTLAGYDLVGVALLAYLLFGQPWFVWAAAFLAVSPDLKWPYRYWFFERKGNEPPEADWLTKFHKWVQWCERPWGILIEITYSVIILWILWRLI